MSTENLTGSDEPIKIRRIESYNVKALKQEVLKEIVKQDKTLNEQVELLLSIPGIGEKTA